ncbi:MAG: hypothetical protein KDB23_27860 [Planctomycetales bacterium]|nr:hypothetical protein [Planctomycetales bacterium]
MIPALLSCVFVAYLYYSLNIASQRSVDVTTATSSLEQRIESLTERIERLSQLVSKKRD